MGNIILFEDYRIKSNKYGTIQQSTSSSKICIKIVRQWNLKFFSFQVETPYTEKLSLVKSDAGQAKTISCYVVINTSFVSLFTAYNGHTDCLRLLLQYSNPENALDCADADLRFVLTLHVCLPVVLFYLVPCLKVLSVAFSSKLGMVHSQQYLKTSIIVTCF